jgi:type II secretory pathway pseudopilin PulG
MKHRSDAGFSLAALIFLATAASILAAAAYPAYQMQAKRELEEELIFRGEEYTRAIQKYQRKFGVYPTSLDQLVETNGLRFVRRAYKDPITDKDFRLITINPDGSLTGSVTFNRTANNQPLFGATQQFGQQPGGLQQQQQQQQNPQRGQQQQPQQQFQQQQFQQQQFQQQFGQQQQQQQPQRGQQQTSPFGQQPQQAQRGGQQLSGFSQPGQSQNPFGGTQTIVAGGIIGVASDSDKDSIKVYNQRQKYNEWEFIAILGQPGQQQPGQPGQQQPGQQNPQGPQGGQNPNNPFGTPTGNPFGTPTGNPFGTPTGNPFGTPTGNPFGTPPGAPGGNQPRQQPGQQPFGFGNTPQQPNQPIKR